jgi:nucleoside-diphosphate-sugar epimerase
MSRILITGATGLVGGQLSAALAARHDVFAVCRGPQPALNDVTWITIDLATDWSRASLPGQIDAVIHLAQSDRWQDFPGCALDVFAVNTASTAKLLDYAIHAGAAHFVVASTGGLYGSVAGAITELSPVNHQTGPLHYYFETKRASEGLALAYDGRLAVTVLRPFFIYGPGQRQPKLIPRLIERIRAGDVVRLRGDSGAQMNPTHVADVVAVIEACLAQHHHGIVNLGGGQVTSIRSMATRIGDVLSVPVRFEFEDGDADCFVADVTRMSALIGRAPVRFDDGIAAVLQRDSRS